MQRRKKGRHEFTRRLITYAIEAGVLARCEDHPGSVYRSNPDPQPACEVVETAWQIGEISSDLKGALDQLRTILDKAPKCCSYSKCWSE